MAIRWVVFDIGGVLEIIPEGGDPTIRFPQMLARWEGRLGMGPGELRKQMGEVSERLTCAGMDRELGTCTEAEWLAEIRRVTGWDEPQLDAFMRDHWEVFCGNPNPELTAYSRACVRATRRRS